MSNAEDSFLAWIETADDLVPVGRGRNPVPVTIGGKTYDGIAAVPIEELVRCSSADYEAMDPAHRSHRSRRLNEAAKDGTLSPTYVQALRARGVLRTPSEEEAS